MKWVMFFFSSTPGRLDWILQHLIALRKSWQTLAMAPAFGTTASARGSVLIVSRAVIYNPWNKLERSGGSGSINLDLNHITVYHIEVQWSTPPSKTVHDESQRLMLIELSLLQTLVFACLCKSLVEDRVGHGRQNCGSLGPTVPTATEITRDH